jgi:hypothetical protein
VAASQGGLLSVMQTGVCSGMCKRRLVLVRVEVCACEPRHFLGRGPNSEVCPAATEGRLVCRTHRCGSRVPPLPDSVRGLIPSENVLPTKR